MENVELDWLKKWATYSPSAVAFVDESTGKKFTYKDCHNISRSLARELSSKHAVSKGDRVALYATNHIETVFLFFAVMRLGAILVPINFRLAPREIDYILNDSGAKVFFYEKQFEKNVSQLSVAPEKVEIFSSIINFVDSVDLVQTNLHLEESFLGRPEDTCKILYTSGTTGFPKGVMVTHKMLFWNSINTSLRLNINQSDVTLAFLPLFHTGGWNVLMTPFLHRGAKTIFLKNFDSKKVLSLCEKHKVTILFGVPTTLAMMSQEKEFESADLSSVRYAVVGGEPMPIPLIQRWAAKKVPVRQGYGLTEFGPNVFSLNEDEAISKIGSIGFANFYTETRIVDSEGADVSDGEVGELILRGPMCMKGYWQNEKATSEAVKEGWLHTGDLARKDAEGFHYIVGRKKEMFISGGENVYPVEVEKFILTNDKVKEVAVLGVPDKTWGEVGKAFIVPQKEFESSLNEDEVREFCIKGLAKYKAPKYFQFMSSLPKGDSGKVLKRALR